MAVETSEQYFSRCDLDQNREPRISVADNAIHTECLHFLFGILFVWLQWWMGPVSAGVLTGRLYRYGAMVSVKMKDSDYSYRWVNAETNGVNGLKYPRRHSLWRSSRMIHAELSRNEWISFLSIGCAHLVWNPTTSGQALFRVFLSSHSSHASPFQLIII